ncbi:YgjV family protein [Paraglaciecola sp.]|uniref:YgjV family protein n=1 Tax=Paraglaciecola sp. TaxID=1920173 RepID=UPI00273E4916|nr:YgjV family protein [Paraglaciecola sp.]MDP5029552.1 YgjV family protein [Paraglaciecola sp.]
MIGLVAACAEWRAYLQAADVELRRWSALGALLWTLMYLMLSAYTAAVMMFLTAIRTLASGYHSARKLWVFSVFMAIFLSSLVFSWQGPLSLLPAFSAINTTIALFYFSGVQLRLFLLASSIAWMANDLIWQAWPALLAEAIALLLNLKTIFALIRIDKLSQWRRSLSVL